jgi:hypothetical protein
MKMLGMVLLVLGALLLLYACNADVSVAGNDLLNRVVNMGLVAQRQAIGVASLWCAIVGSVFYAAGAILEAMAEAAAKQAPSAPGPLAISPSER